MVQILPKVESFGSSFGKAIGAGLGGGLVQGMQSARENKANLANLEREDQEILQSTGIDLRGVVNPDTRKAMFVQALRDQSKQNFNQQKQDFLGEILGTGQRQQQNPLQQQADALQGSQQMGGFDPSQISDADIARATSMDPAIGRELRAAKDTGLRERREDKKNLRKEELSFHKESETYDTELFKQAKIAKSQQETIGSIEKALESGNVKPGSLANIFKGFGKIGDKISEALINEDQATLMASIPNLLEGWKEVFGVRLSDADLTLLQDKLPSIGKTPESNKAITKVLKKYADMTLLRSQIAREIKGKSKGLRPLGYADQIEKRFDEMVMPVKIVNPNNGNVIEIPAYKLSDAIKAGASLANE